MNDSLRPGKSARARLLAVFTLTIFVSAALLFTVQPIVAKLMLPKLGGSAVVWNTSQVFFQAMLLAGYIYAHLVQQRLTLPTQVRTHGALMLLALVFLPLTLSSGAPEGGVAVSWLLVALTTTVGLPFFVLSASAPLFQSWFARTDHPLAEDPYPLYAASNAGSMLSLIAYPFLVEPNMTLLGQRWSWSVGFVGLMGMAVGSGWLATRSTREEGGVGTSGEGAAEHGPITWRLRARWVVLAFIPSALILAVTTFLTTDISSVPLLWILPLSLYLLSFIVVFARPGAWLHGWAVVLTPALVAALCYVLFMEFRLGIWKAVLVHLPIFFVVCVALHGELVRTRPAAKDLTEFYLWMSLGGVLGGAFTALIAPLVFKGLWEYPLLMALSAMALPGPKAHARVPLFVKIGAWLMGLVALGAMVVHEAPDISIAWGALVVLVVLAYAATSLWRPVIAGVVMMALVIAGIAWDAHTYPSLYRSRSYFGIHRVDSSEKGRFHRLLHGNILHGVQLRKPESEQLTPISYYHITNPMGVTLEALRAREDALTVGIIGLGTGSLAAYARPSDTFEFFEIDPEVVAMARDPELFSFLGACPGTCTVTVGDGRLGMAEVTDARYDLIVLDAYSSDAIPIHLITREALAMYTSKLAPGGVIAFHVSNKYLSLWKVSEALGLDAGLVTFYAHHSVSKSLKDLRVKTSTWVLMAREESDFEPWVDEHEMFRRVTEQDDEYVWTDDFANIVDIYRWK